MAEKPERLQKFSPKVIEKLNHYVYCLIDPRSGQIFYVGVGKGNRVFDHIRNEIVPNEGEDDLSEKLSLEIIRKIKRSGLKPYPLVLHYGMKDKDTATEVKRAFTGGICISSLTNNPTSKSSDDRGPTHPHILQEKLQDWCERPIMEFDPNHKLLLLTIMQETVVKRGDILYEACRYSWSLNKEHADTVEYVLVIIDGICRGVFKPNCWKKWEDGRLGFEGDEIYDDEVANRYLNKRIPEDRRGGRNPCQYEGC